MLFFISNFISVIKYKVVKYWAQSCSPSTNKADKIFDRNICVTIVLEKLEGRGRTVSRTSDYAETAVWRVLQKSCYEKFHKTHKKTPVPESLFEKLVRAPFLKNTIRRLLLFIAVSIVVKKGLANETVNYDTWFKTYKSEPEE